MNECERPQIVKESSTLRDNYCTTMVGIEDFPKICRCCLQKCDPRSIFSMNYKNLSLCHVIETCTRVQVVKGDGLPDSICIQCMNLLVICIEFAQKCQESNNSLRQVLKASQNFNEVATIEEVTVKIEEQDPLDIGQHNLFTVTEIEERDPLAGIEQHGPLIDAKIEQPGLLFDAESKKRNYLIVAGAQEKIYDEVTKVLTYIPIKADLANGKHIVREDKGSEQAKRKYVDVSNNTEDIIGEKRRREIALGEPHMTLEDFHKKYARPTVACPTCEERFPSTNQLMLHCKATGHAKPRNHKCDMCGKSFLQRVLLERHITTHTKERNHECPVCGKKFRLYGTMSKHVWIHGGEKKFICETCGRGFFQNHSYQAHMRTHTGERPYLCSYCGKGFTSSSNHLSHERQHEAKKMVSEIQYDTEPVKKNNCKICNKAFSSKGTLKKHMKMHGKAFCCNECEKDFYTETALQEHAKTHGRADLQTPEEEKTFVLLC